MVVKKRNLKWLLFCIGNLLAIIGMLFIYHLYFSSIKLGFSAGLSGLKSGTWYKYGRNGAQLAVRKLTEQWGIRWRKVELLVMDDKNNAETACVVDQKLAKQGVNIIIGHMVSSVAVDTVRMRMKTRCNYD